MKVWYARYPPDDGNGFEMAAVVGDGHPDRTVVDVARTEALEAQGTVLYRSRYRADGRLLRAVIDPAINPAAPAMWYAEAGEPDAEPPAINLVAFATDDFPDGTVVTAAEHQRLGLDRTTQFGALRWWTGNGQVHQVYVAPAARRRGVATTLVLVGAAYSLGRRWPSLWGTGELTDLGAAWIDRAFWASRVQPRTRRLAPMTPADEARGVTRRNLVPDADPDPESEAPPGGGPGHDRPGP